MTQDALVIRDWGQFQSPGSGWEECPYRRAKSGAAVLQSEGQGFNKTKNPMIIGILDQSLATWCIPASSLFPYLYQQRLQGHVAGHIASIALTGSMHMRI